MQTEILAEGIFPQLRRATLFTSNTFDVARSLPRATMIHFWETIHFVNISKGFHRIKMWISSFYHWLTNDRQFLTRIVIPIPIFCEATTHRRAEIILVSKNQKKMRN
jgi:hypothetical protein